MSVGLPRLRAEPDALRQACIDKGENPAVVDEALRLDGRLREIVTERDRLRAVRNAASREIGRLVAHG